MTSITIIGVLFSSYPSCIACLFLSSHPLTMMDSVMGRSIDDVSKETKVINNLRVDPKLEKCIEFKVYQVEGRRKN